MNEPAYPTINPTEEENERNFLAMKYMEAWQLKRTDQITPEEFEDLEKRIEKQVNYIEG